MPKLSARIELIKPSPTLTLDAQVKALKAAGADIINLGVGEPDFQTPEHIREAAVKAIKDGFTRYTPSEGVLELREAVCEKFIKDNGLTYRPSQVVISNGGKHALHNIMQCLFEAGDEVIVPAPFWVTYPDLVRLSGAKPVIARTCKADGYVLRPEALREVLTPRTKGLILNSPSNPTGMVYSQADLEALAPVIEAHDLWVISDDIYEKLLYHQEPFVNLPMVCPDLSDRTVIAHGVSKTYSMTGWRIGFLAGPEPLAKAAAKLQSQTTSNPNSVAQKAALAALTGPQDCVEQMRRTFDRRRRLVLERLAAVDDVDCPEPQGAFYVFPDVSRLFGRSLAGVVVNTSDDLASVLLAKIQVATVPGSGFGQGQALRLSYAASEADLERGLARLTELLVDMHKNY
jgi:aspartate aminotransferase